MTLNTYTLDNSSDWPININGIYAIRSKSTGKIYIGMTRSQDGFRRRWEAHRTLLRKKSHDNDYLQKSYNAHGENDFYFEILEIVDKNDINMSRREWYWIDTLQTMCYQNGWNIDSRDKYKNRKIADRRKFYSLCKTYKIIAPNGKVIEFTGLNKFAKENHLKAPCLIAVIKGKIHSYKGYKSINPNFHRKTPVYKLISPNGIIFEFNNIRKFCREHCLDQGRVSLLLKNKIIQAKGWVTIENLWQKRLPYLISKKYKKYIYSFKTNKILYTKSFLDKDECIRACGQKLIESGDKQQIIKFEVSVYRHYNPNNYLINHD